MLRKEADFFFLFVLQVSWFQGPYMKVSSTLAPYQIDLINTGRLSGQYLMIIYSFVLWAFSLSWRWRAMSVWELPGGSFLITQVSAHTQPPRWPDANSDFEGLWCSDCLLWPSWQVALDNSFFAGCNMHCRVVKEYSRPLGGKKHAPCYLNMVCLFSQAHVSNTWCPARGTILRGGQFGS